MTRYSIYHTNFKKLASLGESGVVAARLMMAMNDFVIADEGLGRWKSEQSPKLQDRKRAAARYFLRLMMAHIHEALDIVKEINNDPALAKSVAMCDAKTRASFDKLVAFNGSQDRALLTQIRNNVAFHYPEKLTLRSIARLAASHPDKLLTFTIGSEVQYWRFDPAEWIENDIAVRAIFKIADEDPADLQASVDEVVVRLHGVAALLSDFAGYFVRHHCKIW